MQFTRSRGIGRHNQRDFDQERADLNEGYRNQRNVYESSLNEAMASNEYSGEQKCELLHRYKEEFLRQEANYRADMQRINDEETQYRAEDGYEGTYASDAQDSADSYCNFTDKSEYDVFSSAMDYSGTVDFSDDTEDNVSANDMSNGM